MIRITYPLNTTNGRVAGFEFKNTRERIYTMHTTKGTKTFLSFSLSNVRFASLIVQSIAELLIPRSSVRYEFVYSAPLESNYFDSLNRRWIQSDTVPISSRVIRHVDWSDTSSVTACFCASIGGASPSLFLHLASTLAESRPRFERCTIRRGAE